jgi:NTE family protein
MLNGRNTIGLALGSGGWRGLAHLGVIKEFRKEGIPIDYIAGSSAGALIGGLYSYFGETEKIEEIVGGLSYHSLYKILLDPVRRSGIVGGRKYLKFLESYIGDVKIEDLKTKFTAVCTDLFNAKPVMLTTGKLSTAIRASSSIPVVFKPVKIGERYFTDGGNVMPVPVKAARGMGADIVIAVNLYNNIFPFKMEYLKKQKLTSLTISRISYQMMLYTLAHENVKKADFVINPKIWEGHFNLFKNFVNNQTTVEDGEEAAKKIIPAIKKLL